MAHQLLFFCYFSLRVHGGGSGGGGGPGSGGGVGVGEGVREKPWDGET